MTQDMRRVILCRTPLNAYVSTLPSDRDFATWQAVLVAELRQHLGASHAAILALAELGPQGFDWVAAGERAVPLNMLTQDAHAALLGVLGGVFQDIEQLAASDRAPALTAAWPALRRIPNEGFLYAVDGRPVLAAWGHAPTSAATWPDPLARLIPPSIPLFPAAADAIEGNRLRSTVPPLMLGLAAAVFLLGLILPGFGLWPFHCVLSNETISLADQAAEALLQNTQIADQQVIAPAPRSSQQCLAQSLPENDWNAGNLSMLNGCWHLTSNMILYHKDSDLPHPISTWIICFDKTGNGTQTVTFQDGDSCTGPLQASFSSNHQLNIDEPSECTGESATIVIAHWICNRTSDSQAECDRTDENGASQGVFQR